jgi:hypothetical protein
MIMSDQPLFQDSDAHEAMDTPEQRPDADDRETLPVSAVVGAGLAGTSATGTVDAGMPAVAAEELAAETQDDTNAPDRS